MAFVDFALTNSLLFFQRGSIDGNSDFKVELEREKTDFSRIRCPLCKWQPRRSDRWMCTDSGAPEFFFAACYTVWNTFETRGRCPGCKHQWRYTSCLRCNQLSPHEDWYEKSDKK